jgi:predicted nucleic acid-binding protein
VGILPHRTGLAPDKPVEPVQAPRAAGAALSLADRQILALAVRHPKSRILTDDGVVRRVALAEGLPVIGTLGLMIRAVRGGIMTRPDARPAVDELIRDHAMRISVDLYQETMRQLQ